jgi:hypothetical protein
VCENNDINRQIISDCHAFEHQTKSQARHHHAQFTT